MAPTESILTLPLTTTRLSPKRTPPSEFRFIEFSPLTVIPSSPKSMMPSGSGSVPELIVRLTRFPLKFRKLITPSLVGLLPSMPRSKMTSPVLEITSVVPVSVLKYWSPTVIKSPTVVGILSPSMMV